MVPNGTLFSNKLVPINATNIHSPYSPYSPQFHVHSPDDHLHRGSTSITIIGTLVEKLEAAGWTLITLEHDYTLTTAIAFHHMNRFIHLQSIILVNCIDWTYPTYNGPYPIWALYIFWGIITISVAPIPVVMLYTAITSSGSFREVKMDIIVRYVSIVQRGAYL